MLSLKAKAREGKKEEGLKGVLYGPKLKNISLAVDLKEFEKVYNEAGQNALVSLEMEGKKYSVIIQDLKIDPISQKPFHVDFYQPRLDEEISAYIPLVFEGESLAVKDLGGTLVRNIYEIEVKALPQNLPHEIKVNMEKLKTFDDVFLVEDLVLPENVKIEKDPKEIIALAAPQEKIEEELEKPIEEKVEEVGKAEEKKSEEEAPQEQ